MRLRRRARLLLRVRRPLPVLRLTCRPPLAHVVDLLRFEWTAGMRFHRLLLVFELWLLRRRLTARDQRFRLLWLAVEVVRFFCTCLNWWIRVRDWLWLRVRHSSWRLRTRHILQRSAGACLFLATALDQ